MTTDDRAAQPGATSPVDPDTNAGASEPEQVPAAADAEAHERCREEIAALTEQLRRRVAEFENFRRRTREEQADMARYAGERLLQEQLPVIDDLRRSLAAGREHPDFATFYAGIELVFTKWMKVLAARGLRPMESVGRPFDAELHDALLLRPDPAAVPGTVLDEIEPGYLLHDRVLRHAKVIVAAEAPDGGAADGVAADDGTERRPS